MSDKKHENSEFSGRTGYDLLHELLHQYGVIVVLASIVVFFGGWGIAHFVAEPGTEVSVWNMFRYTRRPINENELCRPSRNFNPTLKSGFDGTTYKVSYDFSHGREKVHPSACGREYWLKEDKSHPNYGIKFVYLVDTRGNRVSEILYVEKSDGSLKISPY